MGAANRNDRFPLARSNATSPTNRLAERVRQYSDQHPEVSRAELWLDAVPREIDARERLKRGLRTTSGRVTRRSSKPPVTAEDIRIHAWLTERLAVLHHERHGRWPRLRRFLLGGRLVRWLGVRPR